MADKPISLVACTTCGLMDAQCKCHRSASTSNCCQQDRNLRSVRFTIKFRPKHGPNIWERNGRRFTDAEALVVYERERKQRERD